MKKTSFKRWLAAMVAVVLCLATMAPATAAADPAITVGSQSITAGTGTQDVAVPLTLTQNPGMCGLMLKVSYPQGLTVKSVEQGSALSGLMYTAPDLNANPMVIPWASNNGDSTTGVLVTVTFTVPLDAVKTYDITVVAEEAVDASADMNDLTVNITNGKISVTCVSHTWNNGEVTTEPTCQLPGEKTYTCTIDGCGQTKTEPIAAKGHAYGEYTSDNNATCKVDGTKTAVCANGCGILSTVTDTGSRFNVAHTPDGNTDCGKATYCTVCGGVIKAAGQHTWNAGEETKAPTCTATGEKTYTCTIDGCGQTKTEPIAAKSHAYGEYTSDNNATCKVDGTKTAICANGCGIPSTVTDYGSKNSVEHTPDGNTDCTKPTYCTVCTGLIKAAGQHIWEEGQTLVEPTCTEKGKAEYVCQCTAKEERDVPALQHDLKYTAADNVITETCSRQDHTATATLTAADSAYTGAAVETAEVSCGENWQAGELTVSYENNVNVGTATASVTVGEATARVDFAITKATEHTLTLSGLNQTTGSVKPVTATVAPTDASAQITVEYEVTSPAAACTHAHDEACGYVEGVACAHAHDAACGYAEGAACTHAHEEACGENGAACAHAHDEACGYAEAKACTHAHDEACGYAEAKACTHAHDEACGYAEETKAWTTEVPSAVGTYPVRAWLTASDNIEVPTEVSYTTGELKITAPYYGGGSYVPSQPTEDTKQEDTKQEDTKQEDTKQEEQTQTPAKTFTDVADDAWFGKAVSYAVENGLMKGVSETEFAPNATVTRAMVMTVLARQSGAETEGGSTWYEKAMQWAKDNGISDGTNPTGVITREQLATMLFRAANQPAVTGDLSKFADAGNVSEYASAAMAWAVEKGIVTGMTETTLAPKGETTRAQLATILMRFAELSK